MARKCKDCPNQNEEIIEKQEVEEVKEDGKKGYFFPNEGVTIYANSYKEALNILNSTKQ